MRTPASVFDSRTVIRFAGQVDVAPAQPGQLADPQPREHERREHHAPRDVPATVGALRVELPGGVQQRRHVLGPIDPHRRAFFTFTRRFFPRAGFSR